jgi:hypothetical protein
MADLRFGEEVFDANQQREYRAGSEPWPAGKHLVALRNSDAKETKAGDGRMLELEIVGLDGPCKDRVHTERLNLWNKSAEAVEIAKAALGMLCKAVGLPVIKDSSELHGIPFVVDMRVEKRTDVQDAYRNRVVGYYPKNVSQKTSAAAAAAATTGDKAPWQR